MHKARNAAMWAKETKYTTGQPCRRGHYAERYVSNGACVVCSTEAAAKTAKELAEAIRLNKPSAPRLILKARQQEVLDRHGPYSAEEARSVEMDWFVRPTTCGCCIVKLDGIHCAQRTCGQGHWTGVSKEALDLLD